VLRQCLNTGRYPIGARGEEKDAVAWDASTLETIARRNRPSRVSRVGRITVAESAWVEYVPWLVTEEGAVRSPAAWPLVKAARTSAMSHTDQGAVNGNTIRPLRRVAHILANMTMKTVEQDQRQTSSNRIAKFSRLKRESAGTNRSAQSTFMSGYSQVQTYMSEAWQFSEDWAAPRLRSSRTSVASFAYKAHETAHAF
jgi:hypothetical protein